jgi:hypothetical protein
MRYRIFDGNADLGEITIIDDFKLGEGATASVFKINFLQLEWAAKIYKEKSPDEIKLNAMIESCPPFTDVDDGVNTFVQLTWPKYIVKDASGACVGFLMTYIDQEKTYSLDTFYDPVLVKRLQGQAEAALSMRLEIAVNLCTLVAEMHKLGHYFIDIKPQNIRVYKGFNRVVLMDCDGFSIRTEIHGIEKRFPAKLISTDYIAPEVTSDKLSPTVLSENQDRYGLAVILFQLLNRGTHPFQGILKDTSLTASTNDERAASGLYPYGLIENPNVSPRKQSIHDLFLFETRLLFDRAFSNSTNVERPTADQWKKHFTNILENKLLVRCQVKSTDVRHIHFSGMGCIGCRIKAQKSKKQAPNRTYKVLPTTKPLDNKSTTSSPVNTKSSNEIGWTIFLVLLILCLVYAFLSPSGSDKQNKTVEPASSMSTSTNANSTNTCQYNFDDISVDGLCGYYWSNQYPQCDKVILDKLNEKPVDWFPRNKCGSKKVVTPVAPPNDALVEKTLKDKVSYLNSKSSSTAISSSSFPPELKSSNYFIEISNEIINEFNRIEPYSENGLEVYEGINLQFISNVTFTANSGEKCNGTSFGRSSSCLISGNVARCQNIEIEQPVKSTCLETFKK